MLINSKFVKGKEIKCLEDMKQAVDGLWLKDKRHSWTEFVIDNPWISKQWGEEDTTYEDWLNRGLESYIIYERVKEDRIPVFSDEIDNRLDDMLASFAYEYSDSSEYRQSEIMENFLKELKEKFRIEVREDD